MSKEVHSILLIIIFKRYFIGDTAAYNNARVIAHPKVYFLKFTFLTLLLIIVTSITFILLFFDVHIHILENLTIIHYYR